MEIADEVSQKIKNMSLLCAVLVVSIHVGWPKDRLLSLHWWINNVIYETFADIAVPFFFVVSGYFLSRHFDEAGWWRREVGKRIRSLVVPFTIWPLIAFLSMMYFGVVADLLAHRPFGMTCANLVNGCNWLHILGLDFTRCPWQVQLWYVRCLFVFVLLGAVFNVCVRKLKYIWIIGTWILYVAQIHIPCDMLRDIITMGLMKGGVATGIFYFSIGVFIWRFQPRQTSMPKAILYGVVGVCLIGVKIVLVYNGWCCQVFVEKLALPFLVYFTWHFMPTLKLPQWLTSCSSSIFFMHYVVLSNINVLIKHVQIGSVPAAYVAFVGSITISIALAIILRRAVPRFACLIFGGR